jgi:hypothetical protein
VLPAGAGVEVGSPLLLWMLLLVLVRLSRWVGGAMVVHRLVL